MKAILQTLYGGGSGFGISFWKNWMGCEKKALYLERISEAVRNGERAPSLPPKKALITGTVAHGFLELYYRLAVKNAKKALQLNTVAISFVDDAGDPLDVAEDARLQGERLFRAYRAVYPPDEIGEIVEVESLYKGKVVESAVQCSPFTFKPDLVIHLDKAACKRLKKTRYLNDLLPGYYIVDHKTATENEFTDAMFKDEVQFSAYNLGWQWSHPKKELKGTLVNILGKGKRPEFRTIFIEFPNPGKVDTLHTFLSIAQERRQRALATYPYPNITHCYDYRQQCQFRDICNRAA